MGQTSTPGTKLAPGANKWQIRVILNVFVLGQQTLHLIEHNRRVFVLFDPIKRSKVTEKGEPDRTKTPFWVVLCIGIVGKFSVGLIEGGERVP